MLYFWPARRDLNPRSSESESAALSSCATSGYVIILTFVGTLFNTFNKKRPSNLGLFHINHSHSVYAFTRQAVAVTVKEKKNSSKPTIIAPITLVAANVIAKSTIANKIVPKIPASIVLMAALTFLHSGLTVSPVTVNNTARYPTAIPNTTQRKAGVTVIVAVNVKNAATTPIIALAIIAKTVQLFFLPQVNTVIYFHPCYNICIFIGRVTKHQQH